jgi:formylglycine-generating enzyme required for sulfatase activity
VPKSRGTGFVPPRTRDEYRAQQITIPAGPFLRGDDARDDQAPLQTITLAEFQIGRTPVTVAMYQEFVRENPGYQSSQAIRPGEMPKPPAGFCWGGKWDGKEGHPMVKVNYHDALAYCSWAGCLLPTEAQWEKAARGEKGQPFPWGADFNPTALRFSTHGFGKGNGTIAVGSYPTGASAYGVLDMSGNVWEWCQDWYEAGYYQHSKGTNPQGPEEGTHRAARGGAWDTSGEDWFHCAHRSRFLPHSTFTNLGFRGVFLPDSPLERAL